MITIVSLSVRGESGPSGDGGCRDTVEIEFLLETLKKKNRSDGIGKGQGISRVKHITSVIS